MLLGVGMVKLAAVAVAGWFAWAAVWAVSVTPPRPTMGGDVPDSGQEPPAKAWRHWLREQWRRFCENWTVFQLRPGVLIGLALAVLVAGLGLGSGREGLIGVKPSEFAVWFLAPGLGAMLARRFKPDDPETAAPAGEGSWLHRVLQRWPRLLASIHWVLRHWPGLLASIVAVLAVGLAIFYGRLLPPLLILGAAALPVALLGGSWWAKVWAAPSAGLGARLHRAFRLYAPLLLLILLIELVVIVCYVRRGDLGPLLVLVPTLGVLTLIWARSPEHGEWLPGDQTEEAADSIPADPANPPSRAPTPHLALRAGLAVVFLVTCSWGGFVAWRLIQTPVAADTVGASAVRATKRFLTRSAAWYTKEGSWSTQALWIANRYYDDERMLANLHSDLGIVALVRSFGKLRTSAVLFVYALLIGWSLAALGLIASRSSGRHRNATVRLQTRRTTLLLYFVATYLAVELFIHIGSAFNSIWQTGVTLPWISSGGSAALGFGGLCAIALTAGASALITAHRRVAEDSA